MKPPLLTMMGPIRSRTVGFALAGVLIAGGSAFAQPAPPPQLFVANVGAAPLKAPATADFAPSAAFTMEGWFFLNAPIPFGWLMGKGLATAGVDPFLSFGLLLNEDGTRIRFTATTGAPGSNRDVTAPAAFPLRTWTHVAAVMEGTTMRLVINGAIVATGTVTGAPLVDVGTALGVGGAFQANGNPNFPAFSGFARQVRVWSLARTAAQIAAGLNETLPADRTGLVAAWPLDESSGNSGRDLSGNGRALSGGGIWSRLAVLEAGPFFAVTSISPAGNVLDSADDGILIDFDHDGDPDLITFHIQVPPTVPETRRRLRAFRNTNGTFADVTDAVLGDATMVHPRDRFVADFSGDGRADLLVVGHGTDTPPFPGEQAKLFIQSADGRLVDETATRLPQRADFTHNLAVGDIDGDGDGDLYFANIFGGPSTGGPRFYLNNGVGVFTEATDRLPEDIANRTNGVFTSAALADLNGDGTPDLLLSTTGGTLLLADGRTIDGYSIPGVQLLLNRGGGKFDDASAQLHLTFDPSDTWVEWLRVVDLDGDSRPDLVLQGAPNSVGAAFSRTILLNRGDAVFVDASEAYAGGSVTFLAPGDVDRDGIPDLVGVSSDAIIVSRGLKRLDRAVFDGAPAITLQPAGLVVATGGMAEFTVAATGLAPLTYQWSKDGVAVTDGPTISGATTATLSLASLTAASAGSYTVVVTNASGSTTSAAAVLTVTGPAQIASPPTAQSGPVGGTATFTVAATGTAPLTYQWARNGVALPGATAASLTLANLKVGDAGLYTVTVTNAAGSVTSNGAALGITTTELLAGEAFSAPDWRTIAHPNGNRYTQVLLTGLAATVTADPGKVTRISYVDLQDDIVQIEFSGTGTLTVTLDHATGPAAPLNYNQAVQYMKGHASLFIQGAGPSTFVSAFAVGRLTSFDPTGGFDLAQPASATNDPANNANPIFKTGVDYDGHADLALLSIASPTGQFGGILMGNVAFGDTKGLTGIFAPGVTVTDRIRLHDLRAFDAATPVLLLGASPNPEDGLRITGGDLLQANGRAIRLSGVNRVLMSAGVDAHNRAESAQVNQARFERDGVDVTPIVVVPAGVGP